MKKLLTLLVLTLAVPQLWAADGSVTAPAGPMDKTVSLNVEPLWLLVHGIGAKADYLVSERMAVGVQGLYIPAHNNETSKDDNTDTVRYKWSYEEINIGPTFMLTGRVHTNGWYVNPAAGYVRARVSDYGTRNLQGELAAPQLRVTAGHQFINSNFRIALGGGLRVIRSNDIVVKDSDGEEIDRSRAGALGGLALDFHLGLIF